MICFFIFNLEMIYFSENCPIAEQVKFGLLFFLVAALIHIILLIVIVSQVNGVIFSYLW